MNLVSTGIFNPEISSSSKHTETFTFFPNKYGIAQYNKELIMRNYPETDSKDEIEGIIAKSQIAVLMFDMNDENSLKDITLNYLPVAKANESSLYEIIVVGNKTDLMTEKFIFNESGVKFFEISCCEYLNIKALLHQIITSCVYPIKYLKNEYLFVKALTRAFRLITKDSGNEIAMRDFALLHSEIFKVDLDNVQYGSINEVLGNIHENDNVTLDNFISLNQIALQYKELQIPWGFLRFFNYKDNLTIDLFVVPSKEKGWEIIAEELDEFFDNYSENDIIDTKQMEDIFFSVNEKDERFGQLKPREYFLNSNDKFDKVTWLNKWKTMGDDNWEATYLLFLYIGNFPIEPVDDQGTKKELSSFRNIFIAIATSVLAVGVIYMIKRKK